MLGAFFSSFFFFSFFNHTHFFPRFLEEDEIQNIVLRVNSSDKSIRVAVGNFLKHCIFSQTEEEEGFIPFLALPTSLGQSSLRLHFTHFTLFAEAPKAKKTKKKGKKEPVESKSTLNLGKLVDLVIELDLSPPFVVETLMSKVDFLKVCFYFLHWRFF